MRSPWAIYLLVLGCYAATAGGHLYSPDEELLFRTTQSLATGRGLAIEPEGGGFATRPAIPPRTDRREYAQYGIGQPLLAVPAYWIGSGLCRLGGDDLWRTLSAGHYGGLPAAEIAPRWACSWFNILLGPWLAVLVYLIALEMGASRRGATLAALLYSLGTLAWPHSRPFFTESCSTLFVLLSWWAVLRGLRSPRTGWWALAGSAAGYAALVRIDSLFAYPALAILLLGPAVRAARDGGRSIWGFGLAFALPAAVCGALLLGLNRLHFGSFLSSGYADQPEGLHFDSPLLPGLYGLLFSAGKGLFFFSPALVLSFFGWRPLLQTLRQAPASPVQRQPWAVWAALLAAILVPLMVHAKWINWSGGWCWGPRHIFLIHAFLALPIAALVTAHWNAATRIAVWVGFCVGAGVQLLGCSQDFIRFHQRFFRAPGDPSAYFVLYDTHDAQYWSRHYRLIYRPTPDLQGRLMPLIPPAPIRSSLFDPALSVWAGYPVLLREGELDNFWINLARDFAPWLPLPTKVTLDVRGDSQ